jgi:hypothetical protein
MSSTWLPLSASECTASASIAALPGEEGDDELDGGDAQVRGERLDDDELRAVSGHGPDGIRCVSGD